MIERSKFGSRFKGELEVNRGIREHTLIYSIWETELIRDGKCIDKAIVHNRCVDQGLNHILNVQFHAAAQIATWYILIFEDDYTPLAADTYQVPGFTECTAYTEAARQAFVESEATAKSLTNSANKAVFSINATKNIYGGALVSLVTIDDQAAGNFMYCAANFGEAKSVENGDTFKVTVTLSASDL